MPRDFQINKLVRENIRNLVPYSSARDEFTGSASVFLDANENPHNPPLNRYPDPGQSALKEVLASMRGQYVENLFLGNGSDEAIDLLFRVLCEPTVDHVITVDPTYGMYGVCAGINNVNRKSVLLREDFSLDAAAVLDAVGDRTKMIFLCSPNNPTSNSLDREAMLEVIDNAPCVVVVDEAYIDFSNGSGLLSLVPEKRNLVVLQTLSKAWGVAGIRLGMAFAHPELIAFLSAVKYPYNVNTLTMEEAKRSLGKREGMKRWVEGILVERERISGTMAEFGFVERVFPSDANFLLLKVNDPLHLYLYLVKRGIIVRDRSSVPLCDGCLRITVGTSRENSLLLEALKEYEKEEYKS
ncbi:MAG: histidinol-phosphate transaminase [Bacteroidetes bacterium]|nr:histidinol-phosphate transaminase [Bacteroidota bacterium]